VNSLLVKDRMGVLSIGIVRFRYPNVVSHHLVRELFHPSIYRSFCPSIYPSIHQSIYSMHLSIGCLCTCLSVYLFL
jgi:hypothetical protein